MSLQSSPLTPSATRQQASTTPDHVRSFGDRLKGSAVFALNALLAAGLLFGGVVIIQTRASAEPLASVREMLSVQTIAVPRSLGYTVERFYSGRVEAAQTTDMAFERGGTVSVVRVDEGERVRRGDVLAQLDVRSLEAELDQQRAVRKGLVSARERAELDLQRENRLESRGFAADQTLDNARLSVEQAVAALEQVDAAVVGLQIAIDKATLVAPFDGVVGHRAVDAAAIVAGGSSVLTLFDDSARIVRVALPPERVSQLIPDAAYAIRSGVSEWQASLIGGRPDLATTTRTVDVRFRLNGDTAILPFGQRVELSLPRTVEQEGYWVPLSALSEGERGLWSVLVVPDDGVPDGAEMSARSSAASLLQSDIGSQDMRVVHREHVELLHTDGSRAYVQAELGDRASVVQQGSHRVVAGQQVQVAQSDR